LDLVDRLEIDSCNNAAYLLHEATCRLHSIQAQLTEMFVDTYPPRRAGRSPTDPFAQRFSDNQTSSALRSHFAEI
jgi:hypothetical protein